MAEPWIRYKPKNEGKLYKAESPALPYTEGLDPLVGLAETVDYLTTAPLRTGINESLKASGPWNRFKAFGKGVVKSFKNPGFSPSSSEIATRAGLSDEPIFKNKGRVSYGGALSKLSPADLGGFVGEQVLDPANLAPISKAMMLGATATGFKDAKRVFSALWDKKPRFEISDKSLKLKDFGKKPSGEYAKNYNLSDIVDHPELFENYPELKGRLLSFTDNLPKGNAYFTPESESFTLSAKDMDDPETLKKNLLHEIQHWVQRKEGFAKGGSPRDFTEDLRANKRIAESMITEINEKLSDITKRMDFLKQNGFASETKKGTPGYEALLANKKEYEDLLDKRMGLIKNAQIDVSSEAHHQYKRLAGEAEARDTEARRNFPDWLRQKTQPLKSTGLALNDLIVRGVDDRSPNIAMSASSTGKEVLTSVNPTGKVFTKYLPELRAKAELGPNITTLDNTMKVKPSEIITIYRGAPKTQNKINAGDFITTNKQLAKDYAGDGHVIEEKVKASDILDDLTEPMGEEYIYKPQPLTNSQGRPVHPTAEGQENFKKWFEGSKAVDEKGRPLVAYHGTPDDFESFDRSKINKRFTQSFGFHFTTAPSEASVYAGKQTRASSPNVMPVYFNIKNPLLIKTKHPAASMEADLNTSDIINRIMESRKTKNPYDGVIIETSQGDEYQHKNIIVFNPTQIKSATGNSGKFNPKDPNILKGLAPVGPWMLYKRNQEQNQNQNKKER